MNVDVSRLAPAASWSNFIVNLLKIRRVEFIVAEVPILGIPAALSMITTGQLQSWYFLEYVILFFLLFNVGDMANCYCDRDIDTNEKAYLSRAVNELGKNHVLMQIVMTATLAVLISVHLAFATDKFALIPGTLIGIIIALMYSVPPLRIKSRGAWQICWYVGGLFIVPMLFTTIALLGKFQFTDVLVAAAYGTMQTGIVLVNNAEDYDEDSLHAVRTASVQLGLSRIISIAYFMVLGGGLALVLTSFSHIHMIAGTGGISGTIAAVGAATTIWFAIAYQLNKLRLAVSATEHVVALAQIKEKAKLVPLWLTLTSWATFIVAITMRLQR